MCAELTSPTSWTASSITRCRTGRVPWISSSCCRLRIQTGNRTPGPPGAALPRETLLQADDTCHTRVSPTDWRRGQFWPLRRTRSRLKRSRRDCPPPSSASFLNAVTRLGDQSVKCFETEVHFYFWMVHHCYSPVKSSAFRGSSPTLNR